MKCVCVSDMGGGGGGGRWEGGRRGEGEDSQISTAQKQTDCHQPKRSSSCHFSFRFFLQELNTQTILYPPIHPHEKTMLRREKKGLDEQYMSSCAHDIMIMLG